MEMNGNRGVYECHGKRNREKKIYPIPWKGKMNGLTAVDWENVFVVDFTLDPFEHQFNVSVMIRRE